MDWIGMDCTCIDCMGIDCMGIGWVMGIEVGIEVGMDVICVWCCDGSMRGCCSCAAGLAGCGFFFEVVLFFLPLMRKGTAATSANGMRRSSHKGLLLLPPLPL